MSDEALRSRIMRAVKGRDTKPELRVRSLVHRLGYRYSLKRRDLPGSPDLALVARKAAIFVHGCFWHGHDCRRGAREPKTNVAYWRAKIARNVARDAETLRRLDEIGWRTLVIWECEMKDEAALAARLQSFIQPPAARAAP